jgi:hypothetical protein
VVFFSCRDEVIGGRLSDRLNGLDHVPFFRHGHETDFLVEGEPDSRAAWIRPCASFGTRRRCGDRDLSMTDTENRRPKTVHAFYSSKLRDDQQLIHHDQQLIHQQPENNLHQQQEEELGQQQQEEFEQLEDLLPLLELQQLDLRFFDHCLCSPPS